MYIKIFLCLTILSCNNKKFDDISVIDISTKNNEQPKIEKNSMKSINTGFLVLKNTYNWNKILTIYNLDGSKWKSFRFSESFVDNEISPNAMKPENGLLIFKCIVKENGFYKIIINEEKSIFKYIKESDKEFKFQNIKEHILSVFSVDFNEENNPLKSEPNDKAEIFPKNKNSFYYPIKIEGNWLMIEDDNKEIFWIKWCDANEDLILDLFYDA